MKRWALFSRIFTLYSKSLPLDVACRVWDVFCRDGEESLFRTALGILRLFQDVLLQMDFIHIAQFLSRLPDDLQAHTLFAAMANTQMVSRNRRWVQVGVGLGGGATVLLSPPDSDLLSGVLCTHEEWKQRDGEDRQPSVQELALAEVGRGTPPPEDEAAAPRSQTLSGGVVHQPCGGPASR